MFVLHLQKQLNLKAQSMKNFYKNHSRIVCGAAIAALVMSAQSVSAQPDYYESAALGYISSALRTKAGVIAVDNYGSDISLICGSELKTLVSSPGVGRYMSVSPDGRYVGFKSINDDAMQAPALLDIETGDVVLLEPYSNQCGQISFASDGTMAYTVGTKLHVAGGQGRETYDIGLYANIADISADGTKVAYSDIEGNCFVFDLGRKECVSVPVSDASFSRWSPDGAKLAVQQVDGRLSAVEIASSEVFELGEVNSFAWVANSEDIIVSRPERIDDLTVGGASVESVDFRGSRVETVVPLSGTTPVSVSVNGDELLVSYAGGDRGVESIVYDGGISNSSSFSKTSVFKARSGVAIAHPARKNFGNALRSDIREEASVHVCSRAGEVKGENSIGLLDIPYINQLWDTPLIDGGQNSFANVNYGYNCCAAATSCMLLGYYGLLPDDPTRYVANSGKPAGAVQVTKYAWYVAKEYTSPQTGYKFSQSIDDGGYWGLTYGVKGGHGFMWYGDKSPRTAMADFHKNNGARSSSFETGTAALIRECKANRPYAMCLANGTGGHLVLCFRANQIARVDGSATYDKIGSFVCHDPAGDYAAGYWAPGNWDGRFVSYDLPGYNNGNMNIGTFHWGLVTTAATSSIGEISGDADAVRISAVPGRIVIEGSFKSLQVCDVYGRTMPALEVPSGVYIVVVDGKSSKVAVP